MMHTRTDQLAGTTALPSRTRTAYPGTPSPCAVTGRTATVRTGDGRC